MKKTEFKKQLVEMIDQLDGFSDTSSKLDYLKDYVIELQAKNEAVTNTGNKGKPWTDEELEVILSCASTKENCVKFARIFSRGYGSIEQIYRWAGTQRNELSERGREDNAFIQQIHKVKKKLGLR